MNRDATRKGLLEVSAPLYKPHGEVSGSDSCIPRKPATRNIHCPALAALHFQRRLELPLRRTVVIAHVVLLFDEVVEWLETSPQKAYVVIKHGHLVSIIHILT